MRLLRHRSETPVSGQLGVDKPIVATTVSRTFIDLPHLQAQRLYSSAVAYAPAQDATTLVTKPSINIAADSEPVAHMGSRSSVWNQLLADPEEKLGCDAGNKPAEHVSDCNHRGDRVCKNVGFDHCVSPF